MQNVRWSYHGLLRRWRWCSDAGSSASDRSSAGRWCYRSPSEGYPAVEGTTTGWKCNAVMKKRGHTPCQQPRRHLWTPGRHTHLTAEWSQPMSEGVGLLWVDGINVRPDERRHMQFNDFYLRNQSGVRAEVAMMSERLTWAHTLKTFQNLQPHTL